MSRSTRPTTSEMAEGNRKQACRLKLVSEVKRMFCEDSNARGAAVQH